MGLYGTYAIFALQARFPAACILLSAVLLVIFVALATSRPGTVALVPATFVLIWTAQYWVYGVYHGIKGLFRILRVQYEHIHKFVISFL